MRLTLAHTVFGLLAATTALPAFAQELTFWSWRQEDKAVYESLIKDFEAKNPGITVKFEAFEAANYNTILSTALAGEQGPDIMFVRAYGGFEAVGGAGYLMPLDDLPGLKDFPAGALAAETLRADGKVYAVPFASQTMLVVYNKDLFDQVGAGEPETMDELLATAQKLKDAGLFAFANGSATAWQNETIVSALGSSIVGPEFFAEIQAGKEGVDFTDPRYVAGLDALKQYSAFFPDGFVGLDYPSAQQLMASGMAAMYAGGSFEYANFKAQNADLNLGFFAAPGKTKEDVKLVGSYADGGYGGNAKTKHPEAVKSFLAFLASKEFGQRFADELGNLSPVPGVEFTNPVLAEVAELNKNAVPYIMLTNFRYQEPTGSVLLQAAVQKMLAGQATPEEAAAEVTKGIATYYAPFQK